MYSLFECGLSLVVGLETRRRLADFDLHKRKNVRIKGSRARKTERGVAESLSLKPPRPRP
jgi:hypothetical protein